MSFFSKPKTPLALVFDIRDSFISIAVVRFETDTKPELILCKNFSIEGDPTDHKKYLTSMMKTLDAGIVAIIHDLVKIGNTEKIHKYLFFISSPWSLSQTKVIKLLKDKEFVVDDALLERVVTSEETAAVKQIERTSEDKEWVVLEEKIIQSKLNGYKVEKIFNKKASDLEIELFVSFVPREVKEKLSSFIEKIAGKNTKRHYNSSLVASYLFLKDLFPNKNDFIYVDIGYMLTEVYVVRADVLYGSLSYPFGEKHIVQKALSKTGMSEDILLSHITAKHEGHGEAMSQADAQALVDDGIGTWKKMLSDSLTKICTTSNIPNNLFLITNNSLTSFLIKEITNTTNTEPFRLLGTEMKVEAISEGLLNGLIGNSKNSPAEPYIKMDIIFLNKMMK